MASPVALAQLVRFCARLAALACVLFSALPRWRARKVMRSPLAAWRAGGASHCRSASSNGWFGCVGSIQLCRFQCSRHFRTLGGPNYSLKSDRCGVVCGTIMRSRPQRPLSSTVRRQQKRLGCAAFAALPREQRRASRRAKPCQVLPIFAGVLLCLSAQMRGTPACGSEAGHLVHNGRVPRQRRHRAGAAAGAALARALARAARAPRGLCFFRVAAA